MRSLIAALPLLALAACGGASGPETVGSVAPPSGGTSSGGTGSGSGGNGGGIGGGTGTGTPTPTPTAANFLDVSGATTFNAVGAFQSLQVLEDGAGGRGAQLYAGNASTVRAPSGTVAYDPRDGIFTIQFSDTKANVSSSVRFQDPAHRNELGGLSQPSWGVPTNLTDFNYLEVQGPSARAASGGDLGRADSITFFYQRPGSQTKYVSLAGYVRNAFDRTTDPRIFAATTTSIFERGAMVFGQETSRSQVPTSGTGTYTGGMLATMVASPDASQNSYFQWITGSSSLTLDFSKQTMTMLLTGQVSAAVYGGQPVAGNPTAAPAGATFEAKGSGSINLTGNGGFTGNFSGVDAAGLANYVRFVNGGVATPVNITNVSQGQPVAGASSIDGTFFGPDAVNVGGNFRVVGGVPDQRIDILGAFTGAKK